MITHVFFTVVHLGIVWLSLYKVRQMAFEDKLFYAFLWIFAAAANAAAQPTKDGGEHV